MVDILKRNKKYVALVIIFCVFSIGYGIYKINTKEKIDKEIVTIVLQKGDMSKNLQYLIDDFHKENEDIEIKVEGYARDYPNVAVTKLVNQREIDIFEYFDNFLVNKEQISTLDSLNIDYSNVNNGADLNFNNEVIGIKYGSRVGKMIINMDIIEQAGIENLEEIKTFEELEKVAREIKNNVPSVTPIGLSMLNRVYSDMLIGMPSAMNSEIYSTFWNYNKGKYTFTEAEEILEIYREFYKDGLINTDFEKLEAKAILQEFIDGNVAITFTEFYNKQFLIQNASDMNMKILDMPTTNIDGENKRYYYPDNRILVVRNYDLGIESLSEEEKKDIDTHKRAVEKVYEWLLTEEITSELIDSDSNIATFNETYEGYVKFPELTDYTGVEHEVLDPSLFMNVDRIHIKEAFEKIIKSDDDINKALIDLEKNIDERIEIGKKDLKVDLDLYKENE